MVGSALPPCLAALLHHQVIESEWTQGLKNKQPLIGLSFTLLIYDLHGTFFRLFDHAKAQLSHHMRDNGDPSRFSTANICLTGEVYYRDKPKHRGSAG